MKPGLDIVSIGMVTAVGLDAPSSWRRCKARWVSGNGFLTGRWR